MRKILVILLLLPVALLAQTFDFESGVPSEFSVSDSETATLSTVSAPYKDGANSLKWQWAAANTKLSVNYAVTMNNYRNGIILWVYNPTAVSDSLAFEFIDSNETVQYYFHFGLNFKGWRICRIGSLCMKGSKSIRTNLNLRITSPASLAQGCLYLDRFSFVSDVDSRIANDAQLPYANKAEWYPHWACLWNWESKLTYALPVPETLTTTQQNSLTLVETQLARLLPTTANATTISNAKTAFTNAGITRSGDFLVGKPLVLLPDETDTDIVLSDMETILLGLAQDAVLNDNTASRDDFLLAWDYCIDQGFAWGSAMGNNHHYGYEAENIFKAVYLMRDILSETGRLTETQRILEFWSGLPETRADYDNTRVGVVDCWNTLLPARVMAAMMIESETERYRAMLALSNWLNGSLRFTPGNTGGLKPDGCIFHHGGHYPAYGIGGFSGLGTYLGSTLDTEFMIDNEAQDNLELALLSMCRYTNQTDWTIGISGRHPHSGKLSNATISAIGYLAQANAADTLLQQQYERLSNNTTTNVPQGFYVYNHGAFGAYRIGNSMVCLKGYNTDVWGSEIYSANNRYGRYQSYGAVEILNSGSPVSRSNSRFREAGWDWNRLPGTTTIHLPNSKLNSPVSGTLMARSTEDFAGASALQNQYGVFGMKLQEGNTQNTTNFTTDFVARKSVFCFDKRVICIGSGITNSNATYKTETTLFQNALNSQFEYISVNGTKTRAYTVEQTIDNTTVTTLGDVIGNYYRIVSNSSVCLKGGIQNSNKNTNKAATEGIFVAAWINHGAAPDNGMYEYMIMLQPTTDELAKWTAAPEYAVWQSDNTAHIVYDSISGTTAYVCFDAVEPAQGLVNQCSAETMVIVGQRTDNTLTMSVCDPSLHLPEKMTGSNQTATVSQVVIKTVCLKGTWNLSVANEKVSVRYSDNLTYLDVTCQYGIPVEFSIYTDETAFPVTQMANNWVRFSQLSNTLTVENLKKNDMRISVFAATGQQMLCYTAPFLEIDTQQWPSGFYTCVAENKEGRQTFKFILS